MNNKGFTLVEVLVVIAVIAVVVIPIANSLGNTFSFFTQETNQIELQSEGRVFIELLNEKFRTTSAEDISIEGYTSGSTFTGNLIIDGSKFLLEENEIKVEKDSEKRSYCRFVSEFETTGNYNAEQELVSVEIHLVLEKEEVPAYEYNTVLYIRGR